MKTTFRQQPQDKFGVEVYNKPVAEFSEYKVKAGDKVTFLDRFDLITAIVGGFSIRGGVEVMWTHHEGIDNNIDHRIEHIKDLEVLKPKKVKIPTKKSKSKKKLTKKKK